jgi:hypothetical protein
VDIALIALKQYSKMNQMFVMSILKHVTWCRHISSPWALSALACSGWNFALRNCRSGPSFYSITRLFRFVPAPLPLVPSPSRPAQRGGSAPAHRTAPPRVPSHCTPFRAVFNTSSFLVVFQDVQSCKRPLLDVTPLCRMRHPSTAVKPLPPCLINGAAKPAVYSKRRVASRRNPSKTSAAQSSRATRPLSESNLTLHPHTPQLPRR